MLVITRMPSETIVFPSLGITIQLTSVCRSRARIAIDAPTDIKILRGELVGQPHYKKRKNPAELDQKELQKQIDSATLAIHLAQNQMARGLEAHAEDALVHAVEALENLELLLSKHPDWNRETLTLEQPSNRDSVCESKPKYVAKDPQPETAWIVSDDAIENLKPLAKEISSDYEHVKVLRFLDMLNALMSSTLPTMLLMDSPLAPKNNRAIDFLGSVDRLKTSQTTPLAVKEFRFRKINGKRLSVWHA